MSADRQDYMWHHDERIRAESAADERAKCIAEIEALVTAGSLAWSAPGVPFILRRVIRALSVTNQPEDDECRSLSPLGLPTTEREQK